MKVKRDGALGSKVAKLPTVPGHVFTGNGDTPEGFRLETKARSKGNGKPLNDTLKGAVTAYDDQGSISAKKPAKDYMVLGGILVGAFILYKLF